MDLTINRCRFTSDTTGTGSSIHFVAAYSNAYLSPSEAGITDGRKYTYVITQGNDFEIQQDQVWATSTSTIGRGTPAFSKIGGTAGTTKITLDNSAVITFGTSALDFLFNQTRGADVASASTLDLTGTTGRTVNLTGTTTITTVTMNDGQERWALYTGAGLSITVGGSLIGNGNAGNVTLATGDLVIFKGFATSVVRFYVIRISSALAIAAGTSISVTSSTSNITIALNVSKLTNSLAAPVSLNNTSNFFDGPSVAQGTSGIWFASGTVTLTDSASAATFIAKLWDGTTTFALTGTTLASAGNIVALSLSGYITNPAGNIRISVRDLSATTGTIQDTAATLPLASTLSVIRIG